jgi:hypothetical protein
MALTCEEAAEVRRHCISRDRDWVGRSPRRLYITSKRAKLGVGEWEIRRSGLSEQISYGVRPNCRLSPFAASERERFKELSKMETLGVTCYPPKHLGIACRARRDSPQAADSGLARELHEKLSVVVSHV